MKRIFGLTALVGILLSASACTATAPTSAASASTSVSATSATNTPASTVSSGATDAPMATPSTTSSEIFLPVDSGPQPAANGTVTVDSGGNPVSYAVAENDAVSAIADRFGIFVYGLTRPDGTRIISFDSEIETGEILHFKTWFPACRSTPDPTDC